MSEPRRKRDVIATGAGTFLVEMYEDESAVFFTEDGGGLGACAMHGDKCSGQLSYFVRGLVEQILGPCDETEVKAVTRGDH